MATAIPISRPSRDGSTDATIVVADIVNGNAFENDGNVFLILDNKEAAVGSNPITVTVTVTGKADISLTIPNRQYTVNAGEVKFVGPYTPNLYNQPDGTVLVQSSAVLGLIAASILAG